MRRGGLRGWLASLVDPGHDHGVHRRVESLVAIQRARERLGGGHLSLPDQRCQLDRWQKVRICAVRA